MPDGRRARAFIAMWWTLGVVLVILSAQTALHGMGHHTDHSDLHLALLGWAEALAAALFLIPGTMRSGGMALLLIFAVGLLFHATRGEFAGQLLIYAVAVAFCVVHGPVPVWRQAEAA